MYKESQAPSTSKFASVGPWEPKNNISVLRECNSLYIPPLGSVRTHYVVFFSGASSGSNWWSPRRVKRCAGDNQTGSQVRPSAALKRRVQRRARQLRDQTLACSGMHPLIYEYQMIISMIIVMITMQLLVTIMTRLFRGGENLTPALETRLAQLRAPFTFGRHRSHQCSVVNLDCWTQYSSLSGGRETFTEGRIQLWQHPTTVI